MGNRSLVHVTGVSISALAVLAVITSACGTSPSGPTPPAPQTGLTLVSVSPKSGPSAIAAEIRVDGRGFKSGATLTLDGVPASITFFAESTINARTPVHEPATVDVVVTNPDGQSSRLANAYTFGFFSVSGSPETVAAGGDVTVTWVAPAGQGCGGGGDWIAIYPVGAPDTTGAANGHSDLWYTHLCGATAGTARAWAPNTPGEYEFRYMIGDAAAARSNPFTVTAN